MTTPKRRSVRAAVLVGGLLACQAVLYGPSLIGHRLLLPLDLLARPLYYLPVSDATRQIRTHNVAVSDILLYAQPDRRFAASELRAGRIPLWNPYGYAGVPFAVLTTYSPVNLLYYLFPTPRTLAWMEALIAAIAGTGAYLFFRRVPAVGFWPAVFGGWAYPLTGFFVLWCGFPLVHSVAWLPWVLLATHATVRRPGGFGGPGLALVSAFAMLGGQLGLHVMLASGVFFCGCMLDRWGVRRLLRRAAMAGTAAVVAGWALGMMVAMPDWLHLNAYASASARMVERTAGREVRPPGGLAALPQIVLPDLYGSRRDGSYRVASENRLESSAAAYPGLLVALVLVPIGWSSRRHRSFHLLAGALAVLSLGWVLAIPGITSLLRLPGLHLMSHNRFVFVASFAILCAAVVGLEVLRSGPSTWRWWFWLAVAALVALGTFCLYRRLHLPEPIASELAARVRAGRPPPNVPDLATVAAIQATYRAAYARGAALCAAGVAIWLALRIRPASGVRLGLLLGGLALAELLSFGRGQSAQADPALYFPDLPALDDIRAGPPGRILGIGCLPPRLNEFQGLRDIRGYDGFDPGRLVRLLDIPRDERFPVPEYARLQWYVPDPPTPRAGRAEFSPILSLLGVRYFILRGRQPPGVEAFSVHDDYVVLENRAAVPRAFVPERVVPLEDDARVLEALAQPDFDPRRVAYATGAVAPVEGARGRADIAAETPVHLTVAVDMERPGLVVLSELWFEGWTATRDGIPVPIHRTDYALRGIEVPAGASTLELRYEPASFARGVVLMKTALAALALWCAVAWGLRTRRPPPAGAVAAGAFPPRDPRIPQRQS